MCRTRDETKFGARRWSVDVVGGELVPWVLLGVSDSECDPLAAALDLDCVAGPQRMQPVEDARSVIRIDVPRDDCGADVPGMMPSTNHPARAYDFGGNRAPARSRCRVSSGDSTSITGIRTRVG
jgi:hypothetical protein